MPERLKDQAISLSERKALLSALPCFSSFTSNDIEEFASLFSEKTVKPNEVIVTEQAIVDSIYVLVSGIAEVTQLVMRKRRLRKKPKTISIPIALLYPGETIGLSDTGFFSSTGARTATVTAQTTVVLLCLDLTALQLFFAKHPHLNKGMQTSTDQIARMRLIKQSLPFSPLSPERLACLASQVERRVVSAGSVIFHQDDEADRCYLIESGQVEVLVHEKGLPVHTLGILKPPMLFGEAALFRQSRRNATVRALTDCVLLVLKYDYLSELMESESAVSDLFMTLMMDRSRPKKNPVVECYPRKSASGEEIIILKNPMNGQYFKLSNEGWFIWQQLDGTQTMQEITFALLDKFNTFKPDWIVSLMLKLAKGNFIDNLTIGEEDSASKPLWVRWMISVRRVLEARITFKNADPWIDKLYKKAAYLAFTRIGKLLLTLIAASGFISFIVFTEHVIPLFQTVKDSGWLFILVLPLMIISVALHELGHAMMTKYYGYEVNYVGIGWYWLGPVAFTDTSDMWLGRRGPRIMVNLAGVIVDFVTAGIGGLLFWFIPHGYLQCVLWIFVVYTYGSAFRMLSPLQEFDGYYVLMDIFDRPRLRHSAIHWLGKGLPAALRRPRLFRKNKPEICYWLACIVYLALIVLLTFWVQEFVFEIVNISAPNKCISLILPLVIMIVSSLGILAEIRNQKL